MKTKDKRDKGQSKEGSGRVAIYLATEKTFAHSYTLECNYNTGRTTNAVPGASHDKGRASPPSKASSSSPKYNPDVWMNVGRACMASILDLVEENPWSRIIRSRYHTLDAARMVLFNRLRHSSSYKGSANDYKKELAKKIGGHHQRRSTTGSRESRGAVRKTVSRKTKGVSSVAHKKNLTSVPMTNATKQAVAAVERRVAADQIRSGRPDSTQWRVLESPRMPEVSAVEARIPKIRMGNDSKVKRRGNGIADMKLPSGPKPVLAQKSAGNFAGPRARKVKNAASISASGIGVSRRSVAIPHGRLGGRHAW